MKNKSFFLLLKWLKLVDKLDGIVYYSSTLTKRSEKMSIHCCKDCTERYINTQTGERCHSTCEKYAKAVQENELAKKKERAYKDSLIRCNGKFKKVQNPKRR